MSETETLHIDLDQVRQHSSRLNEAAGEMLTSRADVFGRLTNGTSERPIIKSKRNIAVTIGAAPYQHTGTVAGELIADRLASCAEAFIAAEEGLRALGAVMERMAAAVADGDNLSQEELNSLVADLHCVVKVVDGQAPEPNDWFGLEGDRG